MVWNIPLVRLDQLAWLGALPASCPPQPSLLWGCEKQKALVQAAVEKPGSVPARPSTNVDLGKELVYSRVLFLREEIICLENCIQEAVSE